MSVSHTDFFNLALTLCEGPGEIEWRNAAARAYYAAFHRALQTVDLCPDNSHLAMGDHERVTERFKLHESKGAKSIAYVLQSMKRIRHSADYEVTDPFEQSIAKNQIAQYPSLVQRLDSFDQTYRAKEA